MSCAFLSSAAFAAVMAFALFSKDFSSLHKNKNPSAPHYVCRLQNDKRPISGFIQLIRDYIRFDFCWQ
jgi:hypothetical protein